MSAETPHVWPGFHEAKMHWWFTDYGLSPYWALGSFAFDEFDGYTEFDMDLGADDEEEIWHVQLNYHKSGIAPRPSDPIDAERLYEWDLHVSGPGEMKASFNISPRFDDMTKASDGETASIPWCGGEGVDVHINGSNLALEEYQYLLQRSLQELAERAGTDFSSRYFNSIRPESKITTAERYVRLVGDQAKKIVRPSGFFMKLMHLVSDLSDAEWEYSGNNQNGKPKRHAFNVDPAAARELAPGHSLGKRLKCYHPKYIRSTESRDDPLSYPVLRCAFHKSENGGDAVAWKDREDLIHELEETVINVLRWSGVPTTPDVTTFVEDWHFEIRESNRDVGRFVDPTPDLEADQDKQLVKVLSELNDSGEAVLRTLATDGGQHVADVAEENAMSVRTVYRAVESLGELVELDNGILSLTSENIRQEVEALVESLQDMASSTAESIARLCRVETRSAADSALQLWMHTYGVELVDVDVDRGEGTLRFDTILAEMKASSYPSVEAVLEEGLDAWTSVGRDAMTFLEFDVDAEVVQADPTAEETTQVQQPVRTLR